MLRRNIWQSIPQYSRLFGAKSEDNLSHQDMAGLQLLHCNGCQDVVRTTLRLPFPQRPQGGTAGQTAKILIHGVDQDIP